MDLQILLYSITLGLLIALVIYFAILRIQEGGKTVEEAPVVISPVLDYVKWMLSDLWEQGYKYPHIVLFSDGSGRVCKARVGGIENILFHFDSIDGIGTDYGQWKVDKV